MNEPHPQPKIIKDQVPRHRVILNQDGDQITSDALRIGNNQLASFMFRTMTASNDGVTSNEHRIN